MTVNGIDVSNYQGSIDWAAVAADGVQFAFAKCSEGTGFADAYFPANWQGMAANGIARGAYHFARPDDNEAIAEADYFVALLAAAGGLQTGDVLALDMEAGSGDLLDWTKLWLATVEQAVGFKPMLYSGGWFMQPHNLEGDAELAQHGLWYAAYQAKQPAPPPPWPFIAVWQHSDSGHVATRPKAKRKGRLASISGPVDLDVFNGTVEAFRAYGLPAAPPKPLFDEHARFQTMQFVAGGSGVRDLITWLGGFDDAT